MFTTQKEKFLTLYQKHETRFEVGFFLGGFVFDYLTTGAVDDTFMLIQQVFLLLLIGAVLSLEYLADAGLIQIKTGKKLWEYRSPILHFGLGGILNIYSLFFLKSASVFNSIAFVVFLLAVIVGNELPVIRKSGVNLRWALWVLCLFSFFSVIWPLILGFVGWIPFVLTAVVTAAFLYLHIRWMMRYQKNFFDLQRVFIEPGAATILLFILFYAFHLIPPVPLAAQDMGIYHNLEKKEGKFILSHQRPWWKIWETGDQTFLYRPGDQLYFFANVSSPAKFSDQVTIHWLVKEKNGWITSDKVPMQISGGRQKGFRGYSVKKNYQDGEWQVRLETTDGREIGRLYLEVSPDPSTEERTWELAEF
jgi:hypothetical protein